MEQRVAYGSLAERPRLTVVKDGSVDGPFSALPHAIIRRTDISRDARLLVSVLLMYGWQGGDITVSHATLAADMGCGLKSLRVYLDELIAAGIITERDAGRRRQKVYTLTVNTSKTTHWEPVNTAETTDCPPSNAQFLPVQCVVFDQSNTSKTTHSKKKTPEKKTKEEDTAPTEPAPTRSGVLLDLLKASDIAVTMRPQDHRALKESGADPEVVAEAYAAIFRGEWGDEFMRRSLSVQFVIGRLAGYASWKREQSGAVPHLNGTAASLTPATDEDRVIWADALEDLRSLVSPGNFETYLAPLDVAGRLDGGLCLIVPSNVGSVIANYRTAITRALMDAGDPGYAAVTFKSRRSKEPTHAG
jgi:hypothetical protein